MAALVDGSAKDWIALTLWSHSSAHWKHREKLNIAHYYASSCQRLFVRSDAKCVELRLTFNVSMLPMKSGLVLGQERPSLSSDLADSAGAQLNDPEERKNHITGFYENLFDGSDTIIPEWVDDCFTAEDAQLIRVEHLSLAIHMLVNGKTCADDGVVAEC